MERTEPPPLEDDHLGYTFNRFLACRFGRDGVMVNPQNRERRVIREDILETLRLVGPHFSALNSVRPAEEIEACAARDGNHASWLRSLFTETRNVQSMVQASTQALRSAV